MPPHGNGLRTALEEEQNNQVEEQISFLEGLEANSHPNWSARTSLWNIRLSAVMVSKRTQANTEILKKFTAVWQRVRIAYAEKLQREQHTA